MRWFLLTTLVIMIAAGAAADDEYLDGRWGLGLEGGWWKQIHGDHDYSNLDQFGTLKLRHGLSPRWSLDLGLKYGLLRPGVDTPGQDAGFTFDSGAGLYTRIWQPALTATYRLAESAWYVHLLYFLFTGILWVVPAMFVIRWMERPPKNKQA